MSNLKDRIAALKKPKLVPTTFGGVDCFIRRWNERERTEWSIALQSSSEKIKAEDGGEYDAWLKCRAIAKSLCDENGELIFDDLQDVADHESETLNPVFAAVMEVQKISDPDDAKKN